MCVSPSASNVGRARLLPLSLSHRRTPLVAVRAITSQAHRALWSVLLVKFWMTEITGSLRSCTGQKHKCVITFQPTPERVGTPTHNDFHGCPQPLVTNTKDFNELRLIRMNRSNQQNLTGQLGNTCACPGFKAENKLSASTCVAKKLRNDLTVLTFKTPP